MFKLFNLVVAATLAIAIITPAHASDLSQARDTVDRVREADPPSVSTTTKESPVGQPVSDYKPQPGSLKINEPPSPVSRYNPTNDPDVERGYQDHQREHGR